MGAIVGGYLVIKLDAGICLELDDQVLLGAVG